jgi:hypothetical protein
MLFEAGTPICVKCDGERGSKGKDSCGSDDVPKLKAVDKNRRELEEVWRIRTHVARQRYQQCSEELRRIAGDLREGLFESPDGSEAVRQAHHRESAVLEEYTRTLKSYTDLIVRGIVPDEPKS